MKGESGKRKWKARVESESGKAEEVQHNGHGEYGNYLLLTTDYSLLTIDHSPNDPRIPSASLRSAVPLFAAQSRGAEFSLNKWDGLDEGRVQGDLHRLITPSLHHLITP